MSTKKKFKEDYMLIDLFFMITTVIRNYFHTGKMLLIFKSVYFPEWIY